MVNFIMARLLCKCGETLSNGLCPNNVELKVFTDFEWDSIINIGVLDTIDLPDPKYDVWRCPKCERVYVFKSGCDEVIKVYTIEK